MDLLKGCILYVTLKHGFQNIKHILENANIFKYFQSIDLTNNRLKNYNFPKTN